MDVAGIIAICTAAGGVVGAAASGLVVYLKLRHSQRFDAGAVSQYGELADRLERQNARWEADSAAKQKLIDHLAERDTLCQIRLAKNWTWMVQAHARIVWLTRLMRDAGHDPGEEIALPKPPPEYDDTAGFAARSSAQESAAISAANPVPQPIQQTPGAP